MESSHPPIPIDQQSLVALNQLSSDESGLRGDRLLFLIDDEGVALGQDELPRMALIRPRLVGEDLEVCAPDRSALTLALTDQGEPRDTTHLHDRAPAIDQGDRAARWFSEFLGRSCRLMANPNLRTREAPAAYSHLFSPAQSRFAAVAPILLTSEASLADLNARIAKPIRMNRLRPNVVDDGSSAFHEDRWARLRIGDLELEKVASCERRSVTQLDQETAARGIEPIRTLAKYRQQPGGIGGGIAFGIYFRPLAPGVLRLGDRVTLLESQTKFVPNDGSSVIDERDAPVPPGDV